MIGRNIKKTAGTFMVGVLLGIGTMAYAAIAESPFGYYGPYQDYYYKNQPGALGLMHVLAIVQSG